MKNCVMWTNLSTGRWTKRGIELILSQNPAMNTLETLNRKHSFFKFFASVKLAIPLLAALMAVLAAGTFVESFHGTDAARILIYESPWFSALLILLAVNLASAAFDRFPWQKKHIGFVLTHLGIILILAGALVTQKTMTDGQMVLAEGDTEYRVTLPKPLLYIYSESEGLEWVFSLKKRAFAWQGNQKLQHPEDGQAAPPPLQVSLLTYYPKAKAEETVKPSGSGSAAVQVLLKNSFLKQTQWLIENDPDLGQIQMGPARLRFTDKLLKESTRPVSPSGYLEVEKNGESLMIALPEKPSLPAEFPVEGTPYKVVVLEMFKNAVVSGNQLLEQAKADSNPAVQFLLKGPALEERHTAFSRFPEFPTLHGMKPSATGLRIFYRMPHSGSRGEKHELRFVQSSDGLKAQTQTGPEIKTAKAEVGAEVPLGWMDLTYKIENYFPHAAREPRFIPEPSNSQAQDAAPAVQIKVETREGPRQFWIGQGMKQEITSGGKKYDFVFGEKRILAGFKLTLKDFRLENYPGTDRPASYESDVTLKDDSRGVVQNVTISMNKPLIYRGYRIYQAGYSAEEGQPEISIFAVGRDPGVPVKYLGTLIMVGGIITMFFTRKSVKPLEAGAAA